MEERLFLTGVLAPACCAAALVIAALRHRTRWMGLWLAVALSISSFGQQGGLTWPRPGEWTWLALALVAVSVCAAAGGHDAGSRMARGIVCSLAACMGCLLLPLPGWTDAVPRLALTATAAACAACLLPLGMHRGGFSIWTCWSTAIAAPSVVALSCGFAKLAVALGAVSATCGTLAALAIITRHAWPAGMSGSIVIALTCVLGAAVAHAFDSLDTPGWVFVVSGAAPLGAWLGEAPPFRRTALASALARLVGVGIIAGLATWAVAPRLASDGESDAYALAGVLSSIQVEPHSSH
jgi:hypothetical protein